MLEIWLKESEHINSRGEYQREGYTNNEITVVGYVQAYTHEKRK